jgi:hypothetical protein
LLRGYDKGQDKNMMSKEDDLKRKKPKEEAEIS